MAKKRPAKKAERKADKEVGPLVPQPGGRGAIYQGTPANIVPGPGRPPSWFRQEAARLLAEHVDINGQRRARIEFAAAVMDGEFAEASVSDRLKAWQELVKIAAPQGIEISGPGGGPVPHAVLVKLVRPGDANDNS